MIVYDEKLNKFEKNINSYIKLALYQKNIKNECPYCKSKRIIRYGKYNGIQRYLCKNDGCKKTFSNTTGSVWYRSKKSPMDWIKYIEMMFERRSLRECAEEMKFNISTAFYWRHKVLNTLTKVQEKTILEKYVYMRKMPFKENFKGCRDIENKNRDNIYYVLAADSDKKIIEAPICRNYWDGKLLRRNIFSKLHQETKMFSPTDRFLINEIKKIEKDFIHPEVDDKKFLDNYYNGIRRMLKRFFGVATKYLRGYLYWISLFFIGEKMSNIYMFNKLFAVDGYIQCKAIKNIVVGV